MPALITDPDAVMHEYVNRSTVSPISSYFYAGLKYHMENHPTLEKEIHCDECGELFMSTKDLKIHKTVHTGQKVHICEICNKYFLHAHELKNHASTHSDVRHKCDQCGKIYKREEGKSHITLLVDTFASSYFRGDQLSRMQGI